MNSATWSWAASSLAAIRRRIRASSCGSSQALHDLLEVALHQHPHGLGPGDAASHHVEDLVLVELADRPAVGRGHAVGLDDQRRDRVALGPLGEQHLVRLQVGVALLGVGDDVDQPLVRGARVAREGALPDGVAGGVALLVLVGGEQVEVLVALGEVEPGVAHVRALLGGHDVQHLLHETAAQVHGHPAHVRVARDLHALGGYVVDLVRAPVVEVGELHVAARPGIQLEAAGVQCLPADGGAQAVLADRALGVLAHHREGARVLCDAGLVDHVRGLDRALQLHALGHVDEGAPGPERGGRSGELPVLVGEPAHVPLAHEVGVLSDGILERAHDHALLGELGRHLHVDRRGAALDDHGAHLVVAKRVGQHRRPYVGRLVVARLQRVQVEIAKRGGPEARAAPGGHRLGLVGRQRLGATLVQPAGDRGGLVRHCPPRPPAARTRSPSPRARPPAPGRPRGRFGRRA